uniref:Signal peptidase complex subunit 2 n=1 Tax=Endocarpon pusillum TaxID=364733 RepID=F8QX02_9EURO|nr:signal peptidase complex component [Endocarpon pusillum]
MDEKPADGAQKVSLYSINDLKNATDDALAPYLTKLPFPYTFKQSHYYTDVRLAVGYAAVSIAAATFYADWKLGWDATKNYTTAACVLYFILNSFLTLWVWKSEAGKVFVGIREGKQKLTLKSSVKKHVPIYRLKVRYEAPSGKNWVDKEIEGRFSQWFDEAGYLQRAELKKWLAINIEVVGMADPQSKKAIEESIPDEAVQTPIEHHQAQSWRRRVV